MWLLTVPWLHVEGISSPVRMWLVHLFPRNANIGFSTIEFVHLHLMGDSNYIHLLSVKLTWIRILYKNWIKQYFQLSFLYIVWMEIRSILKIFFKNVFEEIFITWTLIVLQMMLLLSFPVVFPIEVLSLYLRLHV